MKLPVAATPPRMGYGSPCSTASHTLVASVKVPFQPVSGYLSTPTILAFFLMFSVGTRCEVSTGYTNSGASQTLPVVQPRPHPGLSAQPQISCRMVSARMVWVQLPHWSMATW